MHNKNLTPQISVSVSLNFAIVDQVHHIFIALIFDQIDAGLCLKLKTKFNYIIVCPVRISFLILFIFYLQQCISMQFLVINVTLAEFMLCVSN